MGNAAFDIIGRYFWLICLGMSAYQYHAASRRAAEQDQLSEPLRARRIQYLQRMIGASTLPWLVMGLGQLTGSTTSVWDYFRPQDLNVFVLAFVASIFVLSLAMAYWVFFRDGARQTVELKLGWSRGLSGSSPMTERQVRLFAGLGPLFVIVWIAACVFMDAPVPRR